MTSGSRLEEAGELLVEPRLRVVAVDERVGELEPAALARRPDARFEPRRRAEGSSAP